MKLFRPSAIGSALAVVLVIGAVVMAARAAEASEIVEVRSERGVVAWLKQEPSIPMLAVSATWRGAGSVSDPAGMAGRANFVSTLLDEGAGEMDSQTFQRRLDDLAIHLSFDAGRDEFGLSLKTLTMNRDEAFRLTGLALAEPRFDKAPVERMRASILTDIAEAKQDPSAIAGQLFNELAFGDDPYSRPADGTAESVKALGRDHFRAFMAERLAKDNLIVGVVGDISPEELKPLLDQAFGALPEKAKIEEPAKAPITPGPKLVVHKFNSPQTIFYFATPGLPRSDPDYEAARVMNQMLGGGGFSSLLTEEIREKRGLTYGVYSYLRPMDRSALWLGGLATGNAQAGEAYKVLRETIRRYAEEGPSEERLAEAKANIIGAFPLRLTSNEALAELLVALQRDDLGRDYVERRPELINAVTLEDVRRLAKRILDLDNLLVVAVGQPEGLPETTTE